MSAPLMHKNNKIIKRNVYDPIPFIHPWQTLLINHRLSPSIEDFPESSTEHSRQPATSSLRSNQTLTVKEDVGPEERRDSLKPLGGRARIQTALPGPDLCLPAQLLVCHFTLTFDHPCGLPTTGKSHSETLHLLPPSLLSHVLGL